MILKIKIDDDQKFVLTKCTSRRGVEIDHNPMWYKQIFLRSYLSSQTDITLFNLKVTEGQEAFKEYNDNNYK